MRIQELIPTIDQELNEGLLDKMFAAGAAYFSKPQAISTLTAKWAEEIATQGKRISKAEDVVGKKLAADPEIISAARSAAAKAKVGATKAANRSAVTQAVGGMLAGAHEKMQTLVKWGIAVAPIVQYNLKMRKWDQQLASGAIDQATYDEIRRKEMSISIAEVAAGLTGATFLKGFGSASSWMTSWSPKLTSVVRGLTTAGQAAAVLWLNSDEGRKWVSYTIFNELYDISDILGGKPVEWLDKFKSLIPGLNSGTSGVSGPQQSAAPAGTTTAPVANKPAAQQSGMLKGTNMQTIDTGPNGPVDIDFK